MLKVVENAHADVVEIEARGVVTAADYRDVFAPAVERVLESGGKPRVLYALGPEFERFELGALVADARLGLGHLADFDRFAVATDHEWVARTTGALGVFLPCPLRVFPYGERDAARTWLSEPGGDAFGLTVEVARSVARVHVRLRGALDHDAEEQLTAAALEGVGDAEEVRVLLEAEEFHGWRDLRALWRHVRFVAGLRSRLERVAIVGEAKWQRRLVGTAKHVLRVDARFFETAKIAVAKAWIDA
ncbi:MAG: STAS/SEC14 domain-containing protein [Planctomycetota bacterium]